MANEARVMAEGTERAVVREITVANGTAIAKGTLLVSSGSRTGVAHTGVTERPLGYTVSDKVASDGNTTVGVQRTGVVVAYIDGVVTTGDIVVLGSTANRVRRMNTSAAGLSYQEVDAVVGRALESGTDGQAIKIVLTLG